MKLIVFVLPLLLLTSPLLVGAEVYQPLSDFHGLEEAAEAAETGDFSVMINFIYRLSIGLASLLAVLVIIVAGIQYSTSAVAGTKENLRERIRMALLGLLLLVGAYVFLELINPELTNLESIEALDIDQPDGFGLTGASINSTSNDNVVDPDANDPRNF